MFYGILTPNKAKRVQREGAGVIESLLVQDEWTVETTLNKDGVIHVAIMLSEAPFTVVKRYSYNVPRADEAVYCPSEGDRRHFYSDIEKVYVVQEYRGKKWRVCEVSGKDDILIRWLNEYVLVWCDAQLPMDYWRKP